MSIIPFPAKRLLPGIPATPARAARVKALDEMQAIFSRQPASSIQNSTSNIQHSPTPEQIYTRGYRALKKLTGFIGPGQLATVKQCLRGEEGEWFMEKMEELASIVESMPVTYGQNGKGDDAICYLHYFGRSYDGYITEKDMEESTDPADAQWQAHGYVHWAQFPGNLSMGYICLPEIFKSHMELDFHFTPTTVREIKAKHGVATEDPPAPSDPPEENDPVPTPPSTIEKWATGKLFISLRRNEGPVDELVERRYDSFDTAWQCLQAWGHTAPDDCCYDKCDLNITFPDGQTLTYRYDLTRDGSDSQTGVDLRTAVLHRLMFYAGTRKPEWMTRDGFPYQYETEPDAGSVSILAAWSDLLTAEPQAPACNAPIVGIESPTDPMVERQKEFLAMPDGYQAGAIIYCSWGYEQTNINFYRIEKRTGAFVTLIPLLQRDRNETHYMSGTTMPSATPKDYAEDHDPAWSNKDKENPKPTFRRKLCIRDGHVNGINVFGCGWASLWDGTPMSWSSYA